MVRFPQLSLDPPAMKKSKLMFLFCCLQWSVYPATAADVGRTAKQPCACKPKPKVHFKSSFTYPLCFFDTELGAINTAKSSWPSYADKIHSIISKITSSKDAAVVVDSRRVVVRTFAWNHRELKAIWPELACVGQSGSMESVRRRRICVSYIKAELKSLTAGRSLPESILEPACQTFLDSNPPLGVTEANTSPN